jgi:hypothetical protein
MNMTDQSAWPKTRSKVTSSVKLGSGQLRVELEQAFEAASDGAIYVVNERFRKASMGPAGWRNCNLRTTFKKIIERAGLKPWPRLFHNLRSSLQTELEENSPTHAVCAWLGNSPDIARKHYLQVMDEHFERAIRMQDALLNPVQLGAETQRSDSQTKMPHPVSSEECNETRQCTSVLAEGTGL